MDNNYQTLADICGVEFQLNYFGLMAEDRERNPERHVDADVTTLEMKREAERLALTNPAIAQAIEKALQGTEADTQEVTGVMAWLQQGSEGQRRIVGSLCRGVLAMTLGDNSGNALLPVILDFRNQALVDRILASEADKIYITYGAAHLLGILELLKNATPAWELVSVKWMQGVTVPVDYEGYLEI